MSTQSTLIGDVVIAQMRDADPFGSFHVTEQLPSSEDIIQVHIGPNFQQVAPRHTVVSASGWHASISRNGGSVPKQVLSDNCLGALAASCLGVAQAFKLALGLPPQSFLTDLTLDLFNLKILPAGQEALPAHPFVAEPQLGRLLMVGAGSVASATAYCLRLLGARGGVVVVDGDVVRIENFNRSPVFGKSLYGRNKAAAVAAHLEGSGMKAIPFERWWSEFIKKQGRQQNAFDVWLPLANEFGVRWSMQNNYPPIMIHASTTNNWGVNHGRHLSGRDDCLADRFSAEVSQEALECSTSEVVMNEERVDAALPFLSLFAGVLVAAELSRLQLQGYPQAPNFALFDFGSDLSVIQAWDFKARSNCMCTSQLPGVDKKFNGSTKYYKLATRLVT